MLYFENKLYEWDVISIMFYTVAYKKTNICKSNIFTPNVYQGVFTLRMSLIIMVIHKCFFSIEHIAPSLQKNGVNIEIGKTNRLKALCMMQINT